MSFKVLQKTFAPLFLFFLLNVSTSLSGQQSCIISSEVSNVGCQDLMIRKIANSGYSNYYAQIKAGSAGRVYFENSYRYGFYADGKLLRVWTPSSCKDVNQYVDTKGCYPDCDENTLTIHNESDCDAEVYINNVMHQMIPANATWTRVVEKNWMFKVQLSGIRDSRKYYRASDRCNQTFTYRGDCPEVCVPYVNITNDTECAGVLLFNNSAARIIEPGEELSFRTEEGYTWQLVSVDNSMMSDVFVSSTDCLQELVFDMACEDDEEEELPVEAAIVTCEMRADDSFEEGWGELWRDGGSDCFLQRNPVNAEDGDYVIRLRDNSMMSSSMYTHNMDLSDADSITLGFAYWAISFEDGEEFLVEYSTDSGLTFDMLYKWEAGSETALYNKNYVSLRIAEDFSENTIFRIRCNASSNADLLYIDNVFFEICESDSESIQDEELITQSRQNNTPVSDILDFTIYPTIATTHIDVRVDDLYLSDVSLHITDLNGREVITEHGLTARETLRVNVAGLSQGMYIASFTNEDGILNTQKIIKK